MIAEVEPQVAKYRGETSKTLVCIHWLGKIQSRYYQSEEHPKVYDMVAQVRVWFQHEQVGLEHLVDACGRIEAYFAGAGLAALDFDQPFDWRAL